jgi:hypothetical protein
MVVCLLAIFAVDALGCPTCKDTLAQNDPARANLVRGYFWSILFMMSMPFLILGGLSTYLYFLVRGARARGWPNRPSADGVDGAAPASSWTAAGSEVAPLA